MLNIEIEYRHRYTLIDYLKNIGLKGFYIYIVGKLRHVIKRLFY
jgi:hypothetical protein